MAECLEIADRAYILQTGRVQTELRRFQDFKKAFEPSSRNPGTIIVELALCGRELSHETCAEISELCRCPVYFVADLVFESVARPLSAWIGRLRILQPLNDWIASLRPYPALALFSVPSSSLNR
jgi:hypothetical protein